MESLVPAANRGDPRLLHEEVRFVDTCTWYVNPGWVFQFNR